MEQDYKINTRVENLVAYTKLSERQAKNAVKFIEEWDCGNGGYVGGRYTWGKSNSAQYASDNGLLTKSQLPSALKTLVNEGLVKASEWHHTGYFKGRMNRTDFFKKDDFIEYLDSF